MFIIWLHICCLCLRLKASDRCVTFHSAVSRHLLRHQRSLLVFTVNLHDLLPTLAALGPGQSRDGLLAADLALRLLLLRLRTGGLVGRRILIGPLDQRRDGRHLGVWLTDVGVVVTVTVSRPSGGQLEDLVGRFVQLVLAVSDRHSLALGLRTQVTVAVDGVEVFGHRVLIVVAVQANFLFRVVREIDIL